MRTPAWTLKFSIRATEPSSDVALIAIHSYDGVRSLLSLKVVCGPAFLRIEGRAEAREL